ncbi:hypothetical protein M3O96_03035 [Aquiflexum sp. TKW24L]|uniref:hypothetical protein n=1 Tax=Aquiflexum sp. TKW24L TaxID=2942212 RepID=UPI0020BF7898|nr:hypothetical protein [Aquiflexum sp. TKW24L]MCL6258045.1 hypothetical protein [Aquiflexum sp. TKW24L]
MATLNYIKRLANLQNRRFDKELNESLISKSFSAPDIPDNVKYMVESMLPINQKYNSRTIDAAIRVQKHLQDGFNLHFNRAYRTQGSVRTGTNIKVHSDFDLLTIIDKYFYPEVSNGNTYTDSDPKDDIKELRRQATKILKGIYDDVDDTHDKCVSIFNKSLNRKVDVVFGFWYNSQKYEQTKVERNDEYYRGIYLYKFPNGPRELDYPFAHIHQVNSKGDTTTDGSRRGIRLLKTLRADSDTELKSLKSFHLTTIVHAIENNNLAYSRGNELSIAKAISEELNKLIQDPTYRKGIKSPNGTETPLEKDEIVPEIKSLKADLDTLIEDSAREILNSQVIKKAILTY